MKGLENLEWWSAGCKCGFEVFFFFFPRALILSRKWTHLVISVKRVERQSIVEQTRRVFVCLVTVTCTAPTRSRYGM